MTHRAHHHIVEPVPVPAPDGRRIAFSSDRSGTLEVYVQILGRTDAEPLFPGGVAEYGGNRPADAPAIAGAFPLDWAGDGSLLVYCTFYRDESPDLWAAPVSGGGEPFPIRSSPFSEEDAAVSPDGGWVA